MIKFKILIFFVFSLCLSFGQVYENIASQQNVNVYSSTANYWAIGMSFYDFNQDGWDDLTYVTQNDTVLFFQNDNGHFSKVNFGIFSPGQMKTLLWVDFDNDDDLDLFATYFDLGIRMYENDGTFNFTDVTSQIGLTTEAIQSYGASFGDYDNDGFLDLYVCNYETLFYYIGAPHTNLLYHNNGNGTFSDVTIQSGTANGYQYSFQGVWIDINKDHLLDLYLINDREQTINALFINNGDGTFSDLAAQYGVTMPFESPMSNSFCDFDNDNDYDIFCSNFGYLAGYSQGYYLYENQADTFFVNNATSLGIQSIGAAWGALWVDYDNDMYNDLYITDGVILNNNNFDYENWFYHNNGGAGFDLINDSILFNTFGKSYSAVKGDINNDGFYDIAVQNEEPLNTFLFQNSGNTNNYVKLTLNTTFTNSQAIGAEVKVYAGGIQQMQTTFCGEMFCSQNSQHLIFGVGSNTVIDSIITIYPSGIINKIYNLNVNQSIQIEETNATTNYIGMNVSDTIYVCGENPITFSYPGYFNYTWNNQFQDDSIVVFSNSYCFFTAYDSVGNTVISDSIYFIFTNPPSFLPIAQNEDCNASNGQIDLIPLWNSNFPYSINWSNNAVGLNNPNITEGWYSYTYSDINNCVYTFDSVYVSSNEAFSIEINTSPQTDLTFGTAEFFPFGGVGPFQYFLNGNQVDNPLTGLTAGSYQLKVIDDNGCEELFLFTIEDSIIGLGINNLMQKPCQVSFLDGNLTIVSSDFSNDLSIEILDLTGKKCFSMSDLSFEKTVVLPISLQSGYYQVNLIKSNVISSYSFIVF